MSKRKTRRGEKANGSGGVTPRPDRPWMARSTAPPPASRQALPHTPYGPTGPIANRLIPANYNAAEQAKPVRDDEERGIDWLERDQALRLLEVASNHPEGDLWTVTLYCGLRQSEALGLTWANVALDEEP